MLRTTMIQVIYTLKIKYNQFDKLDNLTIVNSNMTNIVKNIQISWAWQRNTNNLPNRCPSEIDPQINNV
jgi:hypothetical protein